MNEEGGRPVIYDGVAIKIYADMDPSRILVRFTDGITAYNMIKKARIAGKGQMNNEISAMLAGHLERGGSGLRSSGWFPLIPSCAQRRTSSPSR